MKMRLHITKVPGNYGKGNSVCPLRGGNNAPKTELFWRVFVDKRDCRDVGCKCGKL